jgi:hypothetical protein
MSMRHRVGSVNESSSAAGICTLIAPSCAKTGVAPARPLTPRSAKSETRRLGKSLRAFDKHRGGRRTRPEPGPEHPMRWMVQASSAHPEVSLAIEMYQRGHSFRRDCRSESQLRGTDALSTSARMRFTGRVYNVCVKIGKRRRNSSQSLIARVWKRCPASPAPTRLCSHLDRDTEFLIELPERVQVLQIRASQGNLGSEPARKALRTSHEV